MSEFPWHVGEQHANSYARDAISITKMNPVVVMIYKEMLRPIVYPRNYWVGDRKLNGLAEFADFSLNNLIKWNHKRRELNDG